MGKITARDIAKAANVSLSTVDRVLNNRGGVTDAKERRVIEWARKLKIDRALNQRAARTLRIAVLLQRPENPFHASVQANFEAAARDFPQFNLQFRIHHIDPVKPRATAGLIGSLVKTCDGMVIVSAADPDIGLALRGAHPVAEENGDARGQVAPGASTDYAVLALFRALRVGSRRPGIIVTIQIVGGPFRHVSSHVIQSESIRGIFAGLAGAGFDAGA